MEFKLHPEAVRSFNEKAEELYNDLNYSPICCLQKEQKSFRPDFYISSNLNENDIVGDLKISTVDWTGIEIAIFFYHERKKIGICGENYKKLLKLSENMQRIPQLSQLISVSFLKDSIFNWIKDKYINKISCSLVEYIIHVCEKEVMDSEIWIPLAYTYIQSEIKIGKITLKTITEDILNEWIGREGMDADKKEKNQTACGHPTLKDGVCFGPHARFYGIQKPSVCFAQIALIHTIGTPLSVSHEIPNMQN